MPTLCVSFGTSSSSSVGWLVEKEQCFYEDSNVKFATGNLENFFKSRALCLSFPLSVCPAVHGLVRDKC